jgi:hypothetical protein
MEQMNKEMQEKSHVSYNEQIASQNPHFAVSRRDFVDFFVGRSKHSQDQAMPCSRPVT